jgi:hypothetical protein
MASLQRKQTARIYQIQTARACNDTAYHVPEGIDEIFARAYNLGLLNDVKIKFAKPTKLRAS